MATCEVQVSAADYQTVPTVATGVSKPLCCRLTLTFTLTSENLSLSLYYFNWSFYNYAAHAADILTPTSVVQGVDNHSWGLYCRRCYYICVYGQQWSVRGLAYGKSRKLRGSMKNIMEITSHHALMER